MMDHLSYADLYGMDEPDLKSLHYFSQVALLGSFSNAARALRLTQPAVSRRVAKLERAVGVPNLIGQLLVPPVVAGYRRKHPQVAVHVSEGYSGFIEEWVSAGRVDLGLLWGKPKLPDIDLQPLLALDMCLIAPARPIPGCEPRDRPLAACAFADLVRFPLIVPALPHALRLLAEQAAEKAGRPLNVVMEVEGLVLSKELVKAGLGYALMSHSGDPAEIRANQIRAIRIGPPRVHWVLSLATRRGSRPSAALRELVGELRAVCSEKLKRGEMRGKLIPRGGTGALPG
jgi:DNA-binding transcriptional LysR family regulator